jgi:hypothetical protein
MTRTCITPDGPDRRLDALRKANKIRSRRAQLKKDLAAGSVQIVDILALPPDFAETERVSVLLRAVPKYGSARVTDYSPVLGSATQSDWPDSATASGQN